ncbi:putative C6 transcription factor [Aspergillus affinis]|uniref:putative C6 transcription factor n=1 Tax=Aspergillus affinis TaxID=1070780 RepID=UPI0022FE4E35|nr:C6 transcription factor [Aspergillus affinis]KAI9038443.1 C6 transcription factor [Aspergillus affinis]
MSTLQASEEKGRPPPCKACQNTEAECVFDETLDLRRKVAAKRTLGELEYYRGLLNSLLESLKSPEDNKIQYILDTIRQAPSLKDVASAVDAPTMDMTDAPSDNFKGGATIEDAVAQHERLLVDVHSRITLEKLCDVPVLRVPAKPWSRVTEDEQLVSHLISLYFTWDHPLSQIIDQRMFIEHMSKGDTNSEFCSPLLVNSVLAMASAYSDFPEVFSSPGDLTTKGKHFYAEAERLWIAEDGHTSLTNIQAVALMSCVLSFQTKRKASWLMLRQAVQLAQDFGMFQAPRSSHQEWKKTRIDVQCAAVVTAWGLFALNSQVSLESGKVANLARPRFKPFTRNKLDDEVAWVPYPRSNQIDYDTKPALLASVMAHTTDLTEIVVDIQDLLYDKALDLRMEDTWVAANNLYTRLGAWLEGLPDALQVDEEQIPQILYMHINYHYTTIYLSGFFLDHEGRTLQPAQIEQARLAQLQSANQIAHCLRIHHESYGLRHVPRLMLGPTNRGALALLAALEDEELKESFIELCRFLVAFSKRFSQAQAMIHMIEKRARQMKIALPPEAVAVLDHKELETSQWL